MLPFFSWLPSTLPKVLFLSFPPYLTLKNPHFPHPAFFPSWYHFLLPAPLFLVQQVSIHHLLLRDVSLINHHHRQAADVRHTSMHGASWEMSPTSNEMLPNSLIKANKKTNSILFEKKKGLLKYIPTIP